MQLHQRWCVKILKCQACNKFKFIYNGAVNVKGYQAAPSCLFVFGSADTLFFTLRLKGL